MENKKDIEATATPAQQEDRDFHHSSYFIYDSEGNRKDPSITRARTKIDFPAWHDYAFNYKEFIHFDDLNG